MERREEVEIDYIARIDKLRDELAKLPDVSEKEARAMVGALSKEVKSARQVMQAENRKIQSTSKRTAEGFEGVKRAAEAMGGETAGAAGTIEHMTRSAMSLTSALGPMGAGIAGATLLTGAMVAGMVAASLQAHELQTELREAGRTPVITPHQQRAVEDLDIAMDELSMRAKELVVDVGADLAPAVTTLVVAMADGVEIAGDLWDTWQTVGDGAFWLFEKLTTLGGAFTWPMETALGVLDDYTDSARKANRETRAMADAHEDASRAIQEQANSYADLLEWSKQYRQEQLEKSFEEQARRAEEAARRAAAAEKKNAADRSAAMDKLKQEVEQAETRLQQIRDQAMASQLKGAELVEHERERQLALIRMLEDVSEDHATAQEARLEVIGDAERQLAELREEVNRKVADAHLEDIQRVREAEKARRESMERIAEAERRAAEERQRQRQRDYEGNLQAAQQTAELVEWVTGEIISGNEERTEEAKRSALAAFRIQQAAALIQIGIATATGIARAMEAGPYAGPALAVAAGLQGGLQAGFVAAQQPPEFPMGGLIEPAHIASTTPDHGLVGVQAGESILNRDATARLGQQGVDALNRGEPMSGPMVIEQVYRHRVFDRFVADNLARGGPLDDAIRGRRRVGHRRRR